MILAHSSALSILVLCPELTVLVLSTDLDERMLIEG